VTAHPDDENSGLLSWLTMGLGFETTLLTLTRGEGGQNEIGQELYEALGVLRMEELRAARRYDHAQQRLGRFYEFGYSFSEEETFERWGKDELDQDMVRAFRDLRPHVIFTMPRTT
jgi:LmbE family N-acetylglucosaminyl deacetylase